MTPSAGAAPRPYAVLGLVAVGTFMSALGGSLVNVALPVIRRALGADLGAASWVLAAYSLAVSALLLPAGRLGDLFGKRRVYVTGFAVFGAGSALCALAPTLGLLIAARALQGAGAAMLMSTGPALTTAAFPPAQRGRALGLQATATYTGLTLGPSIGGFLAQHAGWHLVFWINVPVAVVGALLARLVLRPTARAAGHFPWASALLLGPSLCALLIAVTRGQSWGWASPAILGLSAGGALLFGGFLRAETRSPAPLVSATLLAQPGMANGLLAALLQYASAYMLLFLLPFYLQGPLAMTAGAAGRTMTVQPAVMALVTAGSGWLSDRVGTRAPALAGMTLLAAGLVCVATLGAQPERASLLGALGLVGLGAGLFTSPNNSSIMGAAPRERQGTAAGLLAEARNVGMLAGVALAGTVFALLGGGRPGEAAAGAFEAAFRGTVMTAAGLAALGAVMSAVTWMQARRASRYPAPMKLRRASRALLFALGLLALLAVTMVRPDLPRAELLARYASPPSRFADLEGLRVHYRDEGSGPPLVLIHGTSSSLHTWDRWTSLLSSHRRVVRLDLPGFGLTGPAPDRDYSAERQARVVAALLDQLGIPRADLAGNSLGGRVALTFALGRPERVRKLVLLDAAGLSGQRPPAIFRLAQTPVVNRLLTVMTPRWLVEKNVREVYGDPGRVDEARIDRYCDLTRAEGNRTALVDRLTGSRDPDLDARLGELRAPVLLLWGERDRWIPLSFGQRFQAGIAGARLVTYADAGHVPMEELPEATAGDADRFLSEP